MDGNQWINGYLEAILDAGAVIAKHKAQTGAAGGLKERPQPLELNEGKGIFNPTKFFVEEVTSGYDEADLYKTWMKVNKRKT